MNLPTVFDRYRADIDAALRACLDEYRSPLFQMLRYQLGYIDGDGQQRQSFAGKGLRPTLCLLAAEAIAGEYRQAVPGAVALELVHNFSLIHDDIQDDDRKRHHRPTVWVIWGKPQAINAGTAMRVIANLALLRCVEHSAPYETLLRALWMLDEGSIRLLEGQYLDISYEGRCDVTVTDYLDMIERKTAALIACALKMGALLSAADEDVIAGLGVLGACLGMAFQIRDDYLGIWGDEQKTGKPVGNDILRKKKSLPIVFAFEQAGSAARHKLACIFERDVVDERDRDAVMNILDNIHAERHVRRTVNQYSDQAVTVIDSLAVSAWGRARLAEVADFLVTREN